MSIVSFQEMMADATKRHYAVPMFDVSNGTMMRAAVEVAQEENSPVMLAAIPKDIEGDSLGYWINAALYAAKNVKVPVCIHLDHGPSESEVMKALRWGATGIMLDGSAHPYEENVALTKTVVDTCALVGVPVEGELGHIGSVNDDAMDEFTSPEEAAEFVKATGVCCLAVLVGNAHGHYKKPPKLDIERVAAIHKATGGLPLVLHGGSGLTDDDFRNTIAGGIAKVNIFTDLCVAGANAVQNADTDAYLTLRNLKVDAIREATKKKILLFGSNGRA